MENNTNIMQGSWRLIIKSFDYKLLREFEYKTGEICVAIQVRKTEDGNKRMLVENYWSQKISENTLVRERPSSLPFIDNDSNRSASVTR